MNTTAKMRMKMALQKISGTWGMSKSYLLTSRSPLARYIRI
ncbi:hypothetical protein DAD186_13480 [Dermabacter vaginalis]|uniref:Uncharacterized protein n=1 Tax=Dermabacter vaginalis TaxID=1630135 RepID=A0A1B0ZIW8_9MICO|nr:hypothetical protein DAD186_13480 [Dermabacter vaginalis]